MSAPLTFEEFPPARAEDWRAAAEPFLKGASLEKKLVTQTPEGIAIPPISFASDIEDLVESWPGLAPFTRGAHPEGMRSLLITQEKPTGDVKEFNRLLLADLMAGENSVLLRLDAATRQANDPGEEMPSEVPGGLSVTTLADLETALAEVDLAAVPLLVWAGASALPFLGLVGALLEKRETLPAEFPGAILADPLTEWAREGELSLSLSDAYDEMAATISWASDRLPQYRLVGVQAHLWADAGGTAVQELAMAMAAGSEYLRALGQRGIEIDLAAPRLLFSFSLGSQVFMQIAKLRAARRLWTHVVEAFGGDGSAAPASIHARTLAFNKSTLDPQTNLLRTTTEAFVGLVGGVDSIEVMPFDQPCRTPDSFSRRLARNIPLILSEECGLLDVADPAGGSWALENLTNELVQNAWTEFQKIEALGGLAAALRQGVPQSAVTEAGQSRRSALAKGQEVLVGVNLSANPEESLFAGTENAADHSVPASTQKKIPDLEPNPMPRPDPTAAIAAFRRGCSLGQVARSLPRAEAREERIEPISFVTLASEFENLRATSRTATESGSPVRAWLAPFGTPRQHRARVDFSQNFLACGGFTVETGMAVEDMEEAAAAALASEAPVVVICSSDETYPGIVPPLARTLKSARPGLVLVLAGAPGDEEEIFRDAGVDEFIHLRVNRLTVLQGLLEKITASKTKS